MLVEEFISPYLNCYDADVVTDPYAEAQRSAILKHTFPSLNTYNKVNMFYWRISKYNPIYRNSADDYTHDDWTSISDIGCEFNNKILMPEDYYQAENAYIYAIQKIAIENEINYFKIFQLEGKLDPLSSFRFDREPIDLGAASSIASLWLEEKFWCKLENPDMFIHFGPNYNMYVGAMKCISDDVSKAITSKGLFIENFISPYLDTYEEISKGDKNFEGNKAHSKNQKQNASNIINVYRPYEMLGEQVQTEEEILHRIYSSFQFPKQYSETW